jgi:hypothetical protein
MRNDEANLLRYHCDDSYAEGTTNAKQACMIRFVRSLRLDFKGSIEILLNIFENTPRNIYVYPCVIQITETVELLNYCTWRFNVK